MYRSDILSVQMEDDNLYFALVPKPRKLHRSRKDYKGIQKKVRCNRRLLKQATLFDFNHESILSNVEDARVEEDRKKWTKQQEYEQLLDNLWAHKHVFYPWGGCNCNCQI